MSYLVRKMGFDDKNTAEFDQAISIYTDINLVTSTKHKTGEFICYMHKSLSADEFTACCDAANPPSEVAFLQ